MMKYCLKFCGFCLEGDWLNKIYLMYLYIQEIFEK